MRLTRLLAATAVLAVVSIFATVVCAAKTGNLKLDVMGEDGAGAKNPAHVIAANGKEAGQVTAGSSVGLPPPDYQSLVPRLPRARLTSGRPTDGVRTHSLL